MKAIFILVEDMQLKFELLKTDTDAPIVYRSYFPRLIYTRPLSNAPEMRDPIRFIGHDFVFRDRTHRVYVWDLLKLEHSELQKGLTEFLKSRFYSTPNHEETQR